MAVSWICWLKRLRDYRLGIDMSIRGKDWDLFSINVRSHIESYTVPQYGDKGDDLASEYTTEQ